jgi:hypothetical protein
MPEEPRRWLYRLRQGDIPMPEMWPDDLEAALDAAIDTSPTARDAGPGRRGSLDAAHVPPLWTEDAARPEEVAVTARLRPSGGFGYDPSSARSRARLAQW